MSTPNTIKVKPWGDGQGDFVVINEGDFDPAVHQLHDPDADAQGAEAERLAAEQQASSAATKTADGAATQDTADAAAPAAKSTRRARAAAPAADTTEG